MSGAALAAHHYLISSTKQISPKVLKSLKGNSGAKGSTGPAGAAGTAGAKGETGERGPSHAWSAAGTSKATVHLPVGQYSVVGSGVLTTNNEHGPGLGTCDVNDQGTAMNQAFATVPDEGGELIGRYGDATIANEATVTVASSGNGMVSEECEEVVTSKEPIYVGDTAVTAVQLGGLN